VRDSPSISISLGSLPRFLCEGLDSRSRFSIARVCSYDRFMLSPNRLSSRIAHLVLLLAWQFEYVHWFACVYVLAWERVHQWRDSLHTQRGLIGSAQTWASSAFLRGILLVRGVLGGCGY